MNLFFSSPIAKLQRPHFLRRLNPLNYLRTLLLRNIYASAGKVPAYKEAIVQRDLTQFEDYDGHNNCLYTVRAALR